MSQPGPPMSGSGPAAAGDFVGRVAELNQLTELAGKVRAGHPQTAVIQGPPGIGKSWLIRRFLRGLGDFTVLTAVGDPAEALLDLGIIEQLLQQTPPEFRARTSALDTGIPPGANPIAIAGQLLSLLGELQRRSPVALLVDDIQWADEASLQSLRYLLRRVWSEHLLIVLVGRSSAQATADPALDRLIHGVPADLQLELPGLDPMDIAELAHNLYGRRLPQATVRRFHSYSSGHPLLLRSMLHEICSQEPAGIDLALAVPPSVKARVRQTFRSLPEPARALLEALAVLGGHPALNQAAEVAGVEHPAAALDPAIEAGLATWYPEDPACPVAITHDLQREAIYSALTPTRRSQLHRRAAETVEHLHAWRHRVAATTSTDAILAAQLERAAAQEAVQGDHGTAATFLSWAADLTPWGPQREKLLLTAIVHLIFSTSRGRARALHPRATGCAPSALRSLALGLCELYLTGERSAAEQHLEQAFRVKATNPANTWVRGTAAAGLTGIAVWRGEVDVGLEYAAIALAAEGVPGPQRDYVCCLRAVARGRRDGLHAGLEELGHLAAQPADVPRQDLESLACRGAIRALIGQVEEARGDLTEVVRRQEAGAPLLSGVQPHCYLSTVQYQLGEWDACAGTMRRAALLADEDQPAMNQVIRLLATSMVPSARGEWAKAENLVRAAEAAARQVGGPQDLRYLAVAQALLCHARADLTGVLAALSAVPGLRGGSGEPGGPHEWWSSWWGPLLIEALQAAGELDEARTELVALRARVGDSPMLQTTVVRLAAAQADAEGNIGKAVELAESHLAGLVHPHPRPADGHLYHAHGRRLRDLGDRAAALRWLTAATGTYTALGAVPYRQRADADAATLAGTNAPPAAPRLTTRERQIAELVVRGLTNREIAGTLFISIKTVEYHLGNIFSRLGVTSRRELRRYL